MEFTELADYPISPGTLTEWIPSVGPHATTPENAGWLDDARPTSHVHEAHLRSTLASPQSGRESWLGTAFDCDGHLDRVAFRAAVLAWIDRHEGMRTNASVDPDTGVLSRVTAPVGRTDIWVIEQDTCDDSNDVFEHLHHLFDEYTTPLAWPSYAFVTLEPPLADHFTVFFAADHSIIDGFSIVLIAHELTALYREELSGTPAGLSGTRSYLDFGVGERAAIAGVDSSHAAITTWRDFFAETGGVYPSFPIDVGPAPALREPQAGLSAWILDHRQAETFAAACRRTGYGFFPGLMASLGIAAHRVSGAGRFRTVTPVHTRNDPSWAASLGWFVGVGPLAFDVFADDTFADVAQRADAAASSVKDVSRIPLDVVHTALGIGDAPRFVVSYMDVRFAPDAGHWSDINARALRSKKYDHDVYVWLNRTPEGLNIAARFPPSERASAAVHRFVGELRTVLAAVSKTSGQWSVCSASHSGTYTPSK